MKQHYFIVYYIKDRIGKKISMQVWTSFEKIKEIELLDLIKRVYEKQGMNVYLIIK